MIEINRLQKYLFNGLLLSAVAILMRGVAVSFNVFVTSKVGAEGMGLLNLTQTVYGFAITLATSGINLAVVRLVSGALPYGNEEYFDKKADRRVHKIMRNALFYCLFFSLLSSLLLYSGAGIIGAYALGDKRTVPSLKILAFTLTPISLSSALNGYFNAVRRVYKSVIVQVCEQGAKITVVSALLVLIGPKGLEYACIAVVAGGALSEAVCVIVSAALYLFDRKIHKSKRFKIVEKEGNTATSSTFFDLKSISKGCFIAKKDYSSHKKENSIISVALPVAISTYVRSALLTIEHLAIPWGLKKSGASSVEALSSYGVLHGMVFPVLLFPSAVLGSFASLLIPELTSAQEQGDTKRVNRIVSRVFFFALLFSIGVSGIFVCFSNELGEYIYKSKEAAEFIRLLSPLIPLMYLDTAVDSMLKGLGEQLYTMRVNIADAFISVLLVLTLLPSMGIHGYVVVIFLMELFNTSLSIMKLLSITKIKTPVFTWTFKPLISVILATVSTRLIFGSDKIYSLFSCFFNARAVCFIEIFFCAICYLLFAKALSINVKKV
ncbi:MAG: polysaccharide biosynthesis C-terminal domain-containing protein [Clostridia bacterium]|nr:polysaccharide biosynthesis C-terminal domain-containing protein [Clostridia bacterium]